MPVSNNDLREFSDAIWEQFLGLNLKDADEQQNWSSDDSPMTGCIQITGSWTGTVTIGCSKTLSQIAAAAMFAMEVTELAPEDIKDTIGELANMLGGNIKSILPSPCLLSLPTVISGSEDLYNMPGAALIKRVVYSCSGELIVVTIHEKKAS